MKILNYKFQITNFLRHPLFSGSAIMLGGSMLVNVINYVYHLIMGRVLGPTDYGVLASIFSVLYIVSIVPVSTGFSIVKFISQAKGEKQVASTYFAIGRFITKVALLASIILILLAYPLSNFLHLKSIESLLLVSPILFLSLITLVNQATSQGLLNFSGVMLPNLISTTGKFIFGLLFVFLTFGVFGAMSGLFIGIAIACWYSRVVVKKLVKGAVTKNYDIKPFLRYSLPTLISALSFTSLFTTDLLLVKHFLDPFDAGIYAALSTLGKIIYFATQPITAVMFPIVSKRHSLGFKYNKVFSASIALTLAVLGVILSFYYFFPNFMINSLYGKFYLAGAKSLFWMGLFMTFYAISYFLTNYFLSIGKTQLVVLPAVASLLQIVLIFFFFHASILQVIYVSLISAVLLFLALVFFLIYSKLKTK